MSFTNCCSPAGAECPACRLIQPESSWINLQAGHSAPADVAGVQATQHCMWSAQVLFISWQLQTRYTLRKLPKHPQCLVTADFPIGPSHPAADGTLMIPMRAVHTAVLSQGPCHWHIQGSNRRHCSSAPTRFNPWLWQESQPIQQCRQSAQVLVGGSYIPATPQSQAR